MRILAVTLIFSILISSVGFGPGGCPFAYAKEKDFRQLRSEHFIIDYKEEVDESYVRKIKRIAEQYYRVITQQFNFYRDKSWVWENRAKVFIANDRDDYLESFECSPWSTACVDYYGKIIYTYLDQEKFTPVFVHELTHIIFREYIGEGKLPLWLDEGVAVYMEDKYAHTYSGGTAFLKQKIREDSYIKFSELDSITVQSLNSKGQEYVNLFYLESFSIINFITKKYGKYKFADFLRGLRKGQRVEEALAKVFYDFKDLNKMEAKWKDYYQK